MRRPRIENRAAQGASRWASRWLGSASCRGLCQTGLQPWVRQLTLRCPLWLARPPEQTERGSQLTLILPGARTCPLPQSIGYFHRAAPRPALRIPGRRRAARGSLLRPAL